MYTATTHSATGFYPFYLMLDRHPRLSIDFIFNLQEEEMEQVSETEYVTEHLEKLNLAY